MTDTKIAQADIIPGLAHQEIIDSMKSALPQPSKKRRGIQRGVKNALKSSRDRHSETQQTTYTPEEWLQVKADMAAEGFVAHAKYSRRATMNYRRMKRTIAAAKLVVDLQEKGLDYVPAYIDAKEMIKNFQEVLS